jgi:hypothetical protein
MNYTYQYQEVKHAISGESGIYAQLENTEKGIINILVGENEQIARRIIFMVKSGLAKNESLEDDLPHREDLFLEFIEDYSIFHIPNYGGKVYVHKNFQ